MLPSQLEVISAEMVIRVIQDSGLCSRLRTYTLDRFAEVEDGSTTVQDAVTATHSFIHATFTGQVLSPHLLNAVWVIYNRVSLPELTFSLGSPTAQCASLQGINMTPEAASMPEGQTFTNLAL